jgi:(heptosyl)LPS beta-1,4-glucosyltransferase
MLPTEKPYTLSVIVISQDEEDRIDNCLQSVSSIADEIIVLDSGSKDKTVEIALKYTDLVYETDWPGYGIQKQRALEKASCEWVLSIDADEELTPELRQEINQVLASNPVETGFKLRWAVTIYGQTLNHGQSARAPLRLFKREGSRFSEALVHEKLQLPPGKNRKLKGRLLHYTHRDFGHALYKNADYAWLGAQQRFKKRKRGGLFGATARGILVFLHVYIFRGGFLDGPVGFIMAVMYSQVAFNKYAGLWALRRQAELESREVSKDKG